MEAEPKSGFYDYIICGGGCSGLSLAFQINQLQELRGKRILIVEREIKDKNDRTWCFWESINGPFQDIVHHQWDNAWFLSPKFSRLLTLAPYAYKMIKSNHFYEFVKDRLSLNPNIHFLTGEVLELDAKSDSVLVRTSSGKFECQWVFNSIPPQVEKKENHHYLLQHFKGWVIRTKEKAFNPFQPTLMDFRIEQKSECRFMYVLPTTEYEALVEFTIFSENHLQADEYEAQLSDYIRNYLLLDQFEIVHQEFGSIPMFSEPFDKSQGDRVVNIGTAGGQTKASTGYTFTRIQRHSKQLAQNLANFNSPLPVYQAQKSRFQYYDNVLLHVIAKNIVGGSKVFQNLFKYNKPSSIFRFLDEDTRFVEEYRLLNTVPILKFIGPGWKELLKIVK